MKPLNMTLSMESIGFQNPVCFREVTMVIEELRSNSSKVDWVDASIRLAAVIKHHTEMTVKVFFDQVSNGAYMLVPEITSDHPLLNDLTGSLSNADGLTLIRQSKGALKGGVDTKTGKVTGAFTKVPVHIHLPRAEFTGNFFSSAELAGVLCHECGHGYTFFEYLSRSVRNNQVLAGIQRCLDESNTPATREMILTEVTKTVGIAPVDTKSFAAIADRKVVDVVILTAMNRQYTNEVGYDIYDKTSCEMLADQWATRMGAGRDLVTGLSKMYKKYDHIEYRTSIGYIMMEATKLTFLILAPALLVSAAAPSFTAAYILFMLGVTFVVLDADEMGMAGRYDTPTKRFERIKNQLIEKLKDKSLEGNEKAALLADIGTIDSIVGELTERRQIFSWLGSVITAKARYGRDMKLFQQNLEKLAANHLFVTAAALTQVRLPD